MNTKDRYETELDNLKRDLQRVLVELQDVIELTEREDIETAYERACEHLLHQTGQVTEQLRKVRRLDREVQEEREEAKAGN
jgi:hypothetical protein